jgi:hypothetical protein
MLFNVVFKYTKIKILNNNKFHFLKIFVVLGIESELSYQSHTNKFYLSVTIYLKN